MVRQRVRERAETARFRLLLARLHVEHDQLAVLAPDRELSTVRAPRQRSHLDHDLRRLDVQQLLPRDGALRDEEKRQRWPD